MDKFMHKMGITGKFKENFGRILIIAIAVSIIGGLPFFRFDYYDVYLKTYNLTNTQMGMFGTIIGITGIFSYLFGGLIADGLKLKKIIVISLTATGIGGLLHLLPIGFKGLVLIYCVWGISTTFAFWPACVKAIRIMSDNDSEGKAFGFFEGFKNIFAGIIALIAIWLFNIAAVRMDNKLLAMRYVILFYSLANIITAICAYHFINDENTVFHSARSNFKGIGKLIKNPSIWIICIISFCNHIYCISLYYYIPYATNIFQATVVFGAFLGVLRKFGSIGGNIFGGYLTDNIGTYKVMFISYFVVLLSQIVLLLVPVNPSLLFIITFIFTVIVVFFNMNMAMSWTMMTEGGIPVEYSGTAAGLISTAGAVPEVFISVMAGKLIDNNPGAQGYRLFFYFLTFVTFVAFAFVVIWGKYLKNNRIKAAKLDEESKDKIKVCIH
ncbi:MFS transporter [Finegoldia sp. P1-F-LS]|uniref:MFS transporter n=1 Tax=unclassified Finegoldia TaxID=2619637 RepID=UPI00406CA2B1